MRFWQTGSVGRLRRIRRRGRWLSATESPEKDVEHYFLGRAACSVLSGVARPAAEAQAGIKEGDIGKSGLFQHGLFLLR